MKKTTKRFLIFVLAALILLITFFYGSNSIITSKLQSYLKNDLPETIKVDFDDLKVSTRKGELIITNPVISKRGETTDMEYLQLAIDTLLIEDIGYWDYFFNDKISIESILIKQPKAVYKYNDQADFEKSSMSNSNALKFSIDVDQFYVERGNVKVVDVKTDSLLFKIDDAGFSLKGIKISEETLQNKIPLVFENYELTFDALFCQLNEFDNLSIEASKINNERVGFRDVKLYTKYSKKHFSQLLSQERDHFDVNFNTLTMEGYNFGFYQDSIFYFKASNTVFKEPKIEIYRDKLVADDLTEKPLYSKMLRDLNFDLMLDEVSVSDAKIEYNERTKSENNGGKILFTDFNATLKNVGNTYHVPEKTMITVQSMFMNEAPMKADWSFDVNDVNDEFVFSAKIESLSADAINAFSEPNLKVRFEGSILETLFTVNGNANTSRVDLKTRYENFDVIALQKDGKRKNKLLTDVINIFVSKSSDSKKSHFRSGHKEVVERDKTKSVFNFLWLNVKAGLLEAMTNGERKK